MEPLKIVNLYIETDLHGPRRADGVAMYLLETQIRGGTYTKDNKETIIDIPDTTEHHLVLTALKTSLKRITKSCQVEIYLQDRYIAAAIDGGLLQRWMIRDWKTAKNEPVTDTDLWVPIEKRLRKHIVTLHPGEHHGYRRWMQDFIKSYKTQKIKGGQK